MNGLVDVERDAKSQSARARNPAAKVNSGDANEGGKITRGGIATGKRINMAHVDQLFSSYYCNRPVDFSELRYYLDFVLSIKSW